MDEATQIANSGALLSQGPKLFVIDARNRVERRHLLDWLHTSMAEGGPGGELNWVSLPISDERAKMRLGGLAEKLKGDPDTLVVPVRIAWRIPNFEKSRAVKMRHVIFGDPRNPGSFRARSILLRDKRRAHCLTGQPATIGELEQSFAELSKDYDQTDNMEFAAFVVRQAGLVLDIAERGLRGRRYKVPRHVADGLRSDARFRAAMTTLAGETGQSEVALYEQASKYMKELIARPSPLFIDMKAKLDRFMLSQGYEDEVVFDRKELTRLRKTMREHPTLLLFTHKTYIDGVTATDLAYQNDLPLIHLFGGINLDFFGLGFMLRRAGTIFIRRSFENNPVYKLVLRHYVSYLLEKRFPMTWAFEGTRSRLGKLMPPRYGLLKYVMDSAHSNDIEDVHIIPVVTSFDLIRDVEEYASEQKGRIKKPESLSWFFGYLRSLREPMGKVYVDFGEPVIVKKAPNPNDRLALSKMAFEVAVQANRATPLTLTSLMCLCLLGTAPRAMTEVELRAVINFLVGWARERDIRMSDDLTDENLGGVQRVIETLVNNGLLVRYDKGSTVVYAIEPDQHPIASYYRNSIIHHFLDKAIIELSILKAREVSDRNAAEVFWEETDRLRDLFKFEFFYPEKQQYRDNLKAELQRADPEWKAKLDEGGVKLASLTNRFQPLIGHAVFLPFVEAYTVVLDILSRLEPGSAIDKKTCVETALKEGRQAYLLRRITSEASIGKILFENGFRMAAGLGLTGETTPETIAERKALLRKFRALSRRMEKSRLELLALADRIFE
ncbi:MAG: glycerol-3-phosphate 1-O-acyltransferase [Sphingomonadales bacterium]|nr:glycerol-3-phosphate 1-O-acyltransferase [Sphingomonadales bacterium]PIX66308.1 MAG: glycerol-3-phosphate acyltransferase [Sphingomonadales bacterium CG_4_10_14_3_um_filter_58_15]NCO48937.1 glycerol-3-phosphate 1-O-acyltransferase [Sphingomonadales bacterium]NCP01269.1 glycerol-3-phosphate 1-O-acyltransferase [Sphingomonadales bacterium]NCP26409.1 glycerol-3-phosphate 1-O-acyltransferase [Sphingomonadales bacterium]